MKFKLTNVRGILQQVSHSRTTSEDTYNYKKMQIKLKFSKEIQELSSNTMVFCSLLFYSFIIT